MTQSKDFTGNENDRLKAYSETLIRELEEKTLQLEATNRALQEDIAERRRVEASLRASEARVRAIIENEPECVKLVSKEGRLLEMNPAGLRMIEGTDLSDLIGRPILDLIHVEDRAAFADLHQRVSSGESGQLQFRIIGLQGTERWMETHSTPLRESGGAISSVLSVTRDITSQRAARDRLERNAALLRIAGKVAQLGGWTIELPDRVLTWSDETCAIHDVPPGYVPTLEEGIALYPPECRTEVIDHVEACIRDGIPYEFEVPKMTLRGRRIWVRSIGEAVCDDEGNVIRLQGAFQDVTERKQAEEVLRQKDALLRIAGRMTRTGGWAVELPDRSAFWSDEMFDILEFPRGRRPPREEALGLYLDPWREQIVAAMDVCARDGVSFDLELELMTGKGRRIWARVCGEADIDSEGSVKRIQGALQDITDRKKIEQQFLRAQRMEAIGTLAGGIAHDLNNVLTPILLSIELLQLDEKGPEQLKLLTQIEHSAEHGANLVKQVLAFARGVEGHQVPINLIPLTRDLERIVQDTFPKNIHFRIKYAPDLWPLKADATQMHQVLMNLCVNARDAMAASGGQLILELRNIVLDETSAGTAREVASGKHVMICVEDTGTGIPAEIRERIFDPFFTTKEVGKGTGLGLATVATIVKTHGGFIDIHSEGSGTKFAVYLPAHAGPVEAPVAATVQRVLGEGELLLVVDDEQSIRTISRKLLEHCGYRVLLAADGAEAVALYKQRGQEIAAVLTDMAMPVMDGPATIVALRALNPDVKIIGSSGHTGNETATELVGAELPYFINKPFTVEALLNIFARALGKVP